MLLLTLSAACTGAADTMPAVPTPAAAGSYSGSGNTTTAAQLAMTDLHARLREHFDPPWDIQRYDLPASSEPGSDWDSLVAHYAQALGEGWQIDVRYAENAGPGYRSRVWHHGDKAVAIALLAGREESPAQVLTVFVPKAAGR